MSPGYLYALQIKSKKELKVFQVYLSQFYSHEALIVNNVLLSPDLAVICFRNTYFKMTSLIIRGPDVVKQL